MKIIQALIRMLEKLYYIFAARAYDPPPMSHYGGVFGKDVRDE
jgi:hypothetical protein